MYSSTLVYLVVLATKTRREEEENPVFSSSLCAVFCKLHNVLYGPVSAVCGRLHCIE